MDGSDPTKNAIYGALIGLSVAFVFVMGIRHFICMNMRILADAAAAAEQQGQEQEQEQEQEQIQEDPL